MRGYMATTGGGGLAFLMEVGKGFPITPPSSSSSCSFPRLVFPRVNSYASVEPCSTTLSIMINNCRNLPSFIVSKRRRSRIEGFRLFGSIELDRRLLTTDDDQDEMSEGFFEAIEELERMAREPSDVLEEMNNRLSPRELQLVLVYFSQEGRDSWCALEVFEWLQKENRVDKETMELMVSIMCGWAKKLIESQHVVGEVVDLLVDMDCVGLKPSFSMIEKVISLYWEMGKKEKGILFVKEVLGRGISYTVDDGESNKGGPIGYLAWRMMDDGDYHDAVKLVIDCRECGLKPEVYSYLIAMTALVKELKEFSNALFRLKRSMKAGFVAELGVEDVWLIDKYQSDLLKEGVQLSSWVNEEGSTRHSRLVHERLLHMYICAGRGIEAERQLWEMKLLGKQPSRELYDIVLAICASQKEDGAVTRLITGMEFASSIHRKKTLSLMLRGYVKGGHFEDASETLIKMLDMGLCPEFLDRVAVLQGLRKNLHRPGNFNLYLNLCKQLSDANLTSPCLLYLYIDQYKLWMIKML